MIRIGNSNFMISENLITQEQFEGIMGHNPSFEKNNYEPVDSIVDGLVDNITDRANDGEMTLNKAKKLRKKKKENPKRKSGQISIQNENNEEKSNKELKSENID